ncbi:MAG: ketoacyl-ACP synthase III [Bacteroidota bacterium]
MKTARIISSGMYVPARTIPNSYFDEKLGEDVSTWLANVAKIYERHWTDEDESTADLALHAAQAALQNAGLQAVDVDLLIIATDTPEFISPSTASVVQHRLGATKAGTFDLNTACAGFVTGLDVATQYLRIHPDYRFALVVGAYNMSKYLDLSDKKTVTLFADGAGAVVLEGTEGAPGYLSSMLYTQGQYHDGMGIYGGGTHKPISEEVVSNKDHLLKFVYRFPKTLNQEEWSKMAHTLSSRAEMVPDDFDHYFFTQINYNTIVATMEQLGQPMEKAHTVMHHYGYTGSACIPMAFHEALNSGKVKKGDKLMFIGSGGGLAFAGAAFHFV